MNNIKVNPLDIREIVLNTTKPIILKNFQNSWNCFHNGLKSWCKTLDECSGNKLGFERIDIEDAIEPQWERKRQLIQMSALEFFHIHSQEQKFWSGLNYKRKHELPLECTESVDFGIFGFPHANDDCTFWLSSKGANTPCHYDTYGCNIVVQVFGRKSWILMPPGIGLTTTRIPYEESSVYCKENFYNPNSKDKTQLKHLKDHMYHCVLEPNDVLIVPKHWWHFVEALELSLSVNTWIPLIGDDDNQIEECITKSIIEKFIKSKNRSTMEYIMNPNQISEITSDEGIFQLLEYLIKNKFLNENSDEIGEKIKETKYSYKYLNDEDIQILIDKYEFVNAVPRMGDNDLETLLDIKSKSFPNDTDNIRLDENPLNPIEEILINSICSPHIIENIKHELIQRYSSLTNQK